VRVECLDEELARLAVSPGLRYTKGLVRGGLTGEEQRSLALTHRHDNPLDWHAVAAAAVAAHPLAPGRPEAPVPAAVPAPADPLLDLGFTEEEAHLLRTRTTARSLACWQIGDVLVRRFGPGGVSTVRDGSQAKLRSIASLVGGGTTISFLAACRTTSGAWPQRQRHPNVAWNVYRRLAPRPDRVRLLGEFANYCRLLAVVPSRPQLEAWLRRREGTVERPRAAVALGDLRRAIERIELTPNVDVTALSRLAQRLDRLVDLRTPLVAVG
jgi:hypothetical protein